MAGNPRFSNYITAQGARKLKEELDFLWHEERPRVTRGVADAAAEGDRSENAEYIYGKKRLREVDRRIRFLRKRLEVLQVVQDSPNQTDKVFFGAYVTVENEEGEQEEYRLVGPDETDAKQGFISVDSPVGRALMGKRIDDEVTVSRPRGETLFVILALRYD